MGSRWKWSPSYYYGGECAGTLAREDGLRLDVLVTYDPSCPWDGALSPPMDEEWSPPVFVSIQDRKAVLRLKKRFHGGHLGVETVALPPSQSFEWSLSLEHPRLSLRVETPSDAPPLESSPLVEAAGELLSRREPLDRFSRPRLAAVVATVNGSEFTGIERLAIPAPPGTSVDLRFHVERVTQIAYTTHEKLEVEEETNREIELVCPQYEGDPLRLKASTDSRIRTVIDNWMAKRFVVRDPTSTWKNLEGKIVLRTGRPVEATLESGVWTRAPLPPLPHAAALAEAISQDWDRAYDPDFHRFRSWSRTRNVLATDTASIRDAVLLRSARPASDPFAIRCWESLRSLIPPDLGTDARWRSLEGPPRPEHPTFWDRTLTVQALRDAGRIQELAARIDQRPRHYHLSKERVGWEDDPEEFRTTALAAVVLFRAGMRQEAGAVIDRLLRQPMDSISRICDALSVLRLIGAPDSLRVELTQRAWNLLLADRRFLEDSLDLLNVI